MFNYYEFKNGDNITYLELLKPNGQSLGELKNAYNKVSKISLGEVSELSFTLPNVKEIFMQNYGDMTDEEKSSLFSKLENYPQPNIEDIGKSSITLVGYQVFARYSNGLEMIFTIPNRTITSDMMKVDISFTCYSREHELARKLIIDYRGVLIDDKYTLDALTLEEVSRDLLGGTIWELDFLDVGYNNTDVNPIRRTVDAFNNVSLLAALDNISTVFGAIPIYDTINRKVSFYRADNEEYFKYNGLLIDNVNYMNNVKEQKTTDELITRLYGIGANNLTINGVNPTGVSYIEDLSFFIYPAKLNDNKDGLIGHSKYMSDSLALAELLYEEKVADTTITFKELYEEKDTKQSELIILENQLTSLKFELNQIQDYIDVMFVGNNSATEDNQDYVLKRDELDDKQDEIEAKQLEINNKKAEISAINNQLSDLYDDLKIENNFTEEEIAERQCFIYEGLYTNSGIAIAEDLYDEMVDFLNKKKEPKIIIETNINNILSMKSKNAKKDANKIMVGEKIDLYYNYKGIDIDIRAQILAITIDEENNSLDLVISNTQDYKKSSTDYLENILKRSITTSTIVDNNIIDWNKGKIAIDELDDIYQNGIDTAKIQIEGASDNSVRFNERGLTILNTTEPLRFLRATNGVLALTKDGGRTYSTAITPEGIWAERLIGQILIGNELSIIGDDGTLKISNIIEDEYPDLEDEDFGLTLNSSLNRIFITRERGFKITKLNGDVLFAADIDGNLIANNLTVNNGVFNGKIEATTGLVGGWSVNTGGIISGSTNATSKGMLSGDAIAFYAGHLTPSSAPFRVGQDGSLFASNANITGIINATNGSFSGTVNTSNITATGGTIGGWNIGERSLVNDNPNFTISLLSPTVLSGNSDGDVFVVHNKTNNTWPFVLRSDGTFFATKASISGTINATSGTIAGWNITGTYLYYDGVGGTNGARLYRDGRIYMKNDYGWLNCGEGGTILNGNSVVITDQVGASSTGSSNASLGIRAFYGNLRLASNHTIQLLGASLDFGGSNINSLSSYQLTGHTFTGAGNAKMYANANCMFAPAPGYYAYINSTDSSSNRIATSSGGPSSRNVKTNIKNLSSTYDKVYEDLKNMQLYKYKYKYKGIKDYDEDYGFIIEEMEQLPTLSKITKHYEVEGYIEDGKLFPKRDDDEEQKKKTPFKYKEWDRDSYIKLLFVSIKALQQKIEELEKEIEKIKGGKSK